MTIYYSSIELFGDDFFSFALGAIPQKKAKQLESYGNIKAKKESILAWYLFSVACREKKIKNSEIGFEKNGKPCLISGEMYFNLTHSDGLALCAIGKTPLGIDAEKIRTFRPSLAQRIMSVNEYEAAKKSENLNYYATKLWTLKESILKKNGEGIGNGLRKTDFSNVLFEKEFDLYGTHFQSFEQDDFIISICSDEKELTVQKICNNCIEL